MKTKGVIFFLLLVLFFSTSGFSIEGEIDLRYFRTIMILEEGRVKPLDTYAENILKMISGKRKYNGEKAISWLSRVIFNPLKSQQDAVFLISHPDVGHAIGVEVKEERGRYSFAQLGPHVKTLESLAYQAVKLKGEEQTVVETGIIRLYNSVYLYNQLANSLLFVSPRVEFSHLSPNSSNISLLDVISMANQLQDADRHIADEWFSRFLNSPLRIICCSDSPEKWESPWQTLFRFYKAGGSIPMELSHLENMREAYINEDQDAFNTFSKSFSMVINDKLTGEDWKQQGKISLEVLYNRLNTFYRARFFYGFAIVFLLVTFLLRRKWLSKAALFLLIGGFILHTSGIVLRMVIRSRPPVTNLYETFIFAAWISVLLGFVLILFKKRDMGILTGSAAGLLLLLISGKYEMEGDTMGMLMAVLDSNFWLATHVITITVGYAGMVISGIIGHLYVFQKFFSPAKKETLKSTFQSVYATQAFALVFTFVGTVLGGMWADQSWGRFWGWDPKENGALVIILWSAILFHARLSGMAGELVFSLGAIGSIIAVALAWFGVNLLGVGLHSYGFISGVAVGLAIFVGVEIVFVFSSYLFFKIRAK